LNKVLSKHGFCITVRLIANGQRSGAKGSKIVEVQRRMR